MKYYAIKSDVYGKNKVLAVLTYDDEKNTYTIDVPEENTEKEVPFMIASFVKRGQRHIGNEWSMKWVQSRVTPATRQNIGQILRVNHIKSYNEHEFLIKNYGRCCQDECYIEEIEADCAFEGENFYLKY